MEAQARLIRRYAGNRKLYDVRTARYVTHKQVAQMALTENIKILDHKTEVDMTSYVLGLLVSEAVLLPTLAPQMAQEVQEALHLLLRKIS